MLNQHQKFPTLLKLDVYINIKLANIKNNKV